MSLPEKFRKPIFRGLLTEGIHTEAFLSPSKLGEMLDKLFCELGSHSQLVVVCGFDGIGCKASLVIRRACFAADLKCD